MHQHRGHTTRAATSSSPAAMHEARPDPTYPSGPMIRPHQTPVQGSGKPLDGGAGVHPQQPEAVLADDAEAQLRPVLPPTRDCGSNGVFGLTRPLGGGREGSGDDRDTGHRGRRRRSRLRSRRSWQQLGSWSARPKEQGLSLTGPDGLLKQLTKTVLETALDEELTEHLGHERASAGGWWQRPQRDPLEDGADRSVGSCRDRRASRPRRVVRAADRAQAATPPVRGR